MGEPLKERIWLNEDTLWSGFPTDYNDVNTSYYLEEVRNLIFQKKYKEAGDIINHHMVGVWNESYLPMADLFMDINGISNNTNEYYRELDLSKGVSTVRFKSDGVKYERYAFCSFPDQVLVIRLKATGKLKDSVKVRLGSQLNHWLTYENNDIILNGWSPSVVEPDYYPAENPIIYEPYDNTNAIKFQVRLRLITDGTVTADNKQLIVTDGSEILLLLTSANSFQGYDKNSDSEYKTRIIKCLEDAANKTYSELLDRHIKDFNNLFHRVDLDLGHTDNEKLPMDKRIEQFYLGKSDPELIASAFQFGRYLLISSSREGTQPANLQGIWNNALRAPWSSNYTVNINTQMNYWPVENCNLSECAEPLIQLIKDISVTGEKTAKSNYNCRGFVAHHNIDLWRKTTAVGSRSKEVDTLPWSFWPMSGGWLCRHLWDHYTYTMDEKFLRETALPVMDKAALFYLDWLVEYNGELVTNPSTSPENLFQDNGTTFGVTYGSTMDISIIKELFQNCIKAMDILKITEDNELYEEIKNSLAKLPPFKIGRYGQLQEWYEDFEENDPEHRHLSLLYGLYPSDLIDENQNPEVCEACKVTLKRRGEDGVPWSRAWKIGIWARLKDGEKAYTEVKRFLQPANSNEISYTDGGVYNNLFCARPLEVDGNFGFTAGLAEMLVQNHTGKTEFLPAIPSSWKNGYVKGLKIRGNKEIEIEWKDGKIVKSNII
ncbi:glycoside hydrolase family 95 protein [Anaerocolumna sedimenticola]|uniref:Glycoside hydrolase family 95 protein n=1 Tax=Anaerocolumna sedimenticola TaxID=2696063 RepID=A0A6P1TJH2_9FIRM|nr:glycoside hydrolase family 95 protein [Anaerocolumna sedimenticola]QHQ60232.1 glycoside hydrolase family 95 protein [Anaerocolumna sedimenticola]